MAWNKYLCGWFRTIFKRHPCPVNCKDKMGGNRPICFIRSEKMEVMAKGKSHKLRQLTNGRDKTA